MGLNDVAVGQTELDWYCLSCQSCFLGNLYEWSTMCSWVSTTAEAIESRDNAKVDITASMLQTAIVRGCRQLLGERDCSVRVRLKVKGE